MKLSVVIPVYNVEKYLQDCIDSLMAQTYKDCEFIFVDDASTDSCLDILYKNESQFPDKIKVIASKENKCQGGARNIGIKEARGEYIGFIDSDDLSMPDMFKMMCKKAEETNADAVFVKYAAVPDDFRYTDISTFNGKELISWNRRLLDCNEKEFCDEDRMNLIAYPLGGVVCGIWKRNLIIDHGIFFPEHMRYEDNYWITMITFYLNKVAFIDQIGYLYRNSPTSTTHTSNAMYHFDRLTIERSLWAEIKRLNMYRTYRGGRRLYIYCAICI